jgi:hypothetical protein
MPKLIPALAERFARVALTNITTEYPNHLTHLLNGPDDARTPRALHPAFYGSFDWHSSVHMHWLLVYLLRLFQRLPSARDIVEALDRHLTVANLLTELAYVRARGRTAFERPYGWAWLFKLDGEIDALGQIFPQAQGWKEALGPLVEELAARYAAHIAQAPYPIRTGTHANSAFAALLALEWADASGRCTLSATIRERVQVWFVADRDYPARYEPSGDDFLSGGFLEAVLMQRVLSKVAFAVWWCEFRPKGPDVAFWLQPAHVGDRADPKQAHLDGLNLSRAWCMKLLQPSVDPHLGARFAAAYDAHMKVSLPHALEGEYAGTHWLATFAALAMAPI